MVVELAGKDLKEVLPGPYTFQTYYCQRPVPKGLEGALRELSGDTISMALGYGSVFSRAASPDSVPDVLLLSPDAMDFHWAKKRPSVFPILQFALNRLGPNYYQEKIELDSGMQRVKYGVIGEQEFIAHAQGGRYDSELAGRGRGKLYTAGRIQKAILVPIIKPEDSRQRHMIDRAINQARIDGVWLSLGLLPEKFTFDDLARTYVSLSYRADVRVEKKDKVDTLLRNNWVEYQSMLLPILSEFISSGILASHSPEVFQKHISPPKQDVEDWLKKCRRTAFMINYLKNPMTFGLMDGLLYAFAKARRSIQG